MPFDFKKEYKEFYLPTGKPQIVLIPEMSYVAVRGCGNPNEEGGEYQKAIGILYAVSYAAKMSKKTEHKMNGYFDYVVPPLEGFWWQEGIDGIDYSRKEAFEWISAIRLPDFVDKSEFEWAVGEASRKKGIDCSKAELLAMEEGLCVQAMHIGSYDEEPATVEKMNEFLSASGYENDFSDARRHHEIYLSDPRKTANDKLKTVIRHPVKPKGHF